LRSGPVFDGSLLFIFRFLCCSLWLLFTNVSFIFVVTNLFFYFCCYEFFFLLFWLPRIFFFIFFCRECLCFYFCCHAFLLFLFLLSRICFLLLLLYPEKTTDLPQVINKLLMCRSRATCLPAECCLSELTLWKYNSVASWCVESEFIEFVYVNAFYLVQSCECVFSYCYVYLFHTSICL
jgi:hypothetical protein